MGGWPDSCYLAWTPLQRFFDSPEDWHTKTGIAKRNYLRYRQTQRILWWHGDRVVVALGTHPELIWGEEWNDQLRRMIEHQEVMRRRQNDRTREYARRKALRRINNARVCPSLQSVTLYINIGFNCHSCNQWTSTEGGT